MRLAARVIMAIVVLTAAIPHPASGRPARFVVFSDPHYYPGILGTRGSAFESYLAQDRKMLRESDAILRATLRAILNLHRIRKIDFGLIPGDLTKDGERVSHRIVARYLRRLENAGISVYVVPGNHDIDNPNAVRYSGATALPVRRVSAEAFAAFYADFGFDEALDRDPHSLSYVARPVEGLRLIALDSCKYDRNAALGHPETSGAFSDDTTEWIAEKIAEGRRDGDQVIAMMHHGLIEHYAGQSDTFADYVIDDWRNVSERLAAAGLSVVFTGHFHANDITRRCIADFGPCITDIETGSLVTYPSPFRIVGFDGHRRLTVASRFVRTIDYDTGGVPFAAYARNYLLEGLQGIALYLLTQPVDQGGYGLTPELAEIVAPWIADAFIAHHAGDETPTIRTLVLLRLLTSVSDPTVQFLGRSLEALWTDLAPPDTAGEILLTPQTGDVNFDGVVDARDLVIVWRHLRQPAHSCPECDVHPDGRLDLRDLITLRSLCTCNQCACP
jgi:3',5'-cyclic AMP phosphodiesterase CpdA